MLVPIRRFIVFSLVLLIIMTVALRNRFTSRPARRTRLYQNVVNRKVDDLKALSKRIKFDRPDNIAAQLSNIFDRSELTLKSGMLIINIYKELGQLDKACDVIEELIQQRVIPDTGIYNNILDGCAQQSNYTLAEGLLQLMIDRGVRRDIRSYTSIISAFSKAGHWEKAFELLDVMMHQDNVVPDTICYSALITSCANKGRITDALRLLLQMKERDVPIDLIIYNSVISACSKAGNVKAALQLLYHMYRVNIPRDIYVRNPKEYILNLFIFLSFTYKIPLLDVYFRDSCL